MNYDEINDNELVVMINESEEAKDILFEKYKFIIGLTIKKYLKMAEILNIEYNDLYQEALVGFSEAINDYDEERKAGLNRFITLVVERKLQTAIIKAGRLKNKIMAEALSLEHTYEYYKHPLMDILSDEGENDPLDSIAKEEAFKDLINSIKEELSENEYEVFTMMVAGLKYQEIATLLEKDPKQIDNTIQRIKGKIKKILEDR